jgi:16S rRNA (cytosine967-C5)-methyltransferase
MSAKETPRAAALRLLEAVLGEGRMLSEETLDGLSPGDRARAQRLAVDTLRHLDKADYVLEPYLKKAPPLRAMNVLRLATVELCSGGEAHGVVNDAVNLVGASKRGQVLKGMVNAVLRRVAGEGQERWDTAPGARLPAWLRQPLLASWGTPAVRAMEARFEEVPSLDLTAKGDAAALAQALAGDLLPTGTVRLAAGAQVSALAGFAEGAFWVQDAAAALPARLLAAQPGERVLDLCAAPGGKTMQLATSGAQVVALDLSQRRMARLRDNLARVGLTAELVVGDALDHQGRYDAILLDAPCSATGTLRRHPDLPYVRDAAAVTELVELQARMLDHALGLLGPGGRLVYCTCSLLPQEGEAQVQAALARHADLRVEAVELAGVPEAWRTEEGGIRTRPDYWPDQGGMDGFYMARLTRAGGALPL